MICWSSVSSHWHQHNVKFLKNGFTYIGFIWSYFLCASLEISNGSAAYCSMSETVQLKIGYKFPVGITKFVCLARNSSRVFISVAGVTFSALNWELFSRCWHNFVRVLNHRKICLDAMLLIHSLTNSVNVFQLFPSPSFELDLFAVPVPAAVALVSRPQFWLSCYHYVCQRFQ